MAAATNTNWLATGDRSHPTLVLIDELKNKLTYDGYENDLIKLDELHFQTRVALVTKTVSGMEVLYHVGINSSLTSSRAYCESGLRATHLRT